MSQAKQCPFVLSFDAIYNLETIFEKLSEKSYRAAPDSDHAHFRPEFHLPTQLLVHAHGEAPKNNTGRHANLDLITNLLRDHNTERSMTSDCDVCFSIKSPYIRLVCDSDHGIHRDPTVYGEGFIPTQLVLAHANRLNDLLVSRSSRNSAQYRASGKLNITIVTNFPATINAARAEGFGVWNYSDGSLRVDSVTPLEQLLMEQGLIAREPIKGQLGMFQPVLYVEDSTPEPSPVSSELIEDDTAPG